MSAGEPVSSTHTSPQSCSKQQNWPWAAPAGIPWKGRWISTSQLPFPSQEDGFPPPSRSVGWGRSKQSSANPSWRCKQSSGPALSTSRPSECCYLPQILLQEGDLPVVPSLPGTVVGQAEQPGVELIAQGWPQPLLVSLEHLERERGRAESQSTSMLWGRIWVGRGCCPAPLTPSCGSQAG